MEFFAIGFGIVFMVVYAIMVYRLYIYNCRAWESCGANEYEQLAMLVASKQHGEIVLRKLATYLRDRPYITLREYDSILTRSIGIHAMWKQRKS
jgi:hypothetical protein